MSKMNKTELVRKKAEEIILAHTGGISRQDVILKISEDPDIQTKNISDNTISTQLNVLINESVKISRVGRGIFAPIPAENEVSENVQKGPPPNIPKESVFYESFRDYLINDLNECVKAACLPDMRRNKKWGNPDIVGVQKKLPGQIVDFPIEIVSAEVKNTPTEIATAFGQAASYLIFSHKTYVVVPRSVDFLAELDRLEAQAHMLGIGMVTFVLDKDKPDYQVVIRARTNNPNMFYLNNFVDSIRKYDSKEFNDLFG